MSVTYSARRHDIDVVRTICNYLIVVLHASAVGQYLLPGSLEWRWLTFLCRFLSSGALPSLFFVSGYLLFSNFSRRTYKDKMLRRIKRLLVPYICWNLLFVAYYHAIAAFSPRISERIAQFGLDTIQGILSKVLSLTVHPIDGPLWFIRTLLFFAVASPILWWLIMKCKGIFAAIAVAVYVMFCCSCGMNEKWALILPAYSVVAFAFGGWVAVWSPKCTSSANPLRLGGRIRWACLALAVCAGAFYGLLGFGWMGRNPYMEMASCLVSSLGVFALAELVANSIAETRWFLILRDSSFFVYAGHFLFCQSVLHFLGPLWPGSSAVKGVTLLFAYVVVGPGICMLTYCVGRRLFGRVLGLLDGSL